jgi:hypothetical protein
MWNPTPLWEAILEIYRSSEENVIVHLEYIISEN